MTSAPNRFPAAYSYHQPWSQAYRARAGDADDGDRRGETHPQGPSASDRPLDRFPFDDLPHGLAEGRGVVKPEPPFEDPDDPREAGVAAGSLRAHAPPRDPCQEPGCPRVHPEDRRVPPPVDPANGLAGECSGIRGPAGQHLVQDDSQGVDVGARVDAAGIVDLLGRGVGDRAEHRPVAGEALVGLLARGGDAEVRELHVALAGDQDVARLDVAVDHAALMRVAQGFRDLVEDQRRRVGGKVAFPADQLVQRDPVDILLDDVVVASLLEVIVHLHDVIVLEVHHQARFPPEAFHGTADAPEVESFQEHDPVQGGVPGLVQRPHPALGDLPDDLVLADLPVRRVVHRYSAASGRCSIVKTSRSGSISAPGPRRAIRKASGSWICTYLPSARRP